MGNLVGRNARTVNKLAVSEDCSGGPLRLIPPGHANLFSATTSRRQLIFNDPVGQVPICPAPGIDLVEQQLEGIARGSGDLHRLSGPSIRTIEQRLATNFFKQQIDIPPRLQRPL